jgi:single-strand DNA-binding protein
MDQRNSVVLIGRLVADPELKFLPSGAAVASFSLAVNRPVRKDDGTFEDTLDGFFDCEFYGPAAETLAAQYRKGTEVQVAGSLRQRKWKVGNGAGGRTASKIEVKAKTVSIVVQGARKQDAAPPAAEVREPQPA